MYSEPVLGLVTAEKQWTLICRAGWRSITWRTWCTQILSHVVPSLFKHFFEFQHVKFCMKENPVMTHAACLLLFFFFFLPLQIRGNAALKPLWPKSHLVQDTVLLGIKILPCVLFNVANEGKYIQMKCKFYYCIIICLTKTVVKSKIISIRNTSLFISTS